jgi:hypothetical protein
MEAAHRDDASFNEPFVIERPFRDSNGNISEEFTAPTILALQEVNQRFVASNVGRRVRQS